MDPVQEDRKKEESILNSNGSVLLKKKRIRRRNEKESKERKVLFFKTFLISWMKGSFLFQVKNEKRNFSKIEGKRPERTEEFSVIKRISKSTILPKRNRVTTTPKNTVLSNSPRSKPKKGKKKDDEIGFFDELAEDDEAREKEKGTSFRNPLEKEKGVLYSLFSMGKKDKEDKGEDFGEVVTEQRKKITTETEGIFKSFMGKDASSYLIGSRPILEAYFRAHFSLQKMKPVPVDEIAPQKSAVLMQHIRVIQAPVKVAAQCEGILQTVTPDPDEEVVLDRLRTRYEASQRQFMDSVGSQDLNFFNPEGEDAGGRGRGFGDMGEIGKGRGRGRGRGREAERGGKGRGGSRLMLLQSVESTGTVSTLSHGGLIFDMDYLFALSYAYVFKFVTASKMMDPNCVSSFASLLEISGIAGKETLKVKTPKELYTADYVSSYKNLMGALRSFQGNAVARIPAKFDRLLETKKVVLDALNISLARRGEGLSKVVTIPRGSRIDIQEWNTVHFLFIFRLVFQMYQVIAKRCRASVCPEMTGSSVISYTWSEKKHANSIPACQYIKCLNDWILEKLQDPEIFPPTGQYKRQVTQTIKQMVKRLVRVIAHIYYAHMEHFRNATAHENRRTGKGRFSQSDAVSPQLGSPLSPFSASLSPSISPTRSRRAFIGRHTASPPVGNSTEDLKLPPTEVAARQIRTTGLSPRRTDGQRFGGSPQLNLHPKVTPWTPPLPSTSKNKPSSPKLSGQFRMMPNKRKDAGKDSSPEGETSWKHHALSPEVLQRAVIKRDEISQHPAWSTCSLDLDGRSSPIPPNQKKDRRSYMQGTRTTMGSPIQKREKPETKIRRKSLEPSSFVLSPSRESGKTYLCTFCEEAKAVWLCKNCKDQSVYATFSPRSFFLSSSKTKDCSFYSFLYCGLCIDRAHVAGKRKIHTWQLIQDLIELNKGRKKEQKKVEQEWKWKRQKEPQKRNGMTESKVKPKEEDEKDEKGISQLLRIRNRANSKALKAAIKEAKSKDEEPPDRDSGGYSFGDDDGDDDAEVVSFSDGLVKSQEPTKSLSPSAGPLASTHDGVVYSYQDDEEPVEVQTESGTDVMYSQPSDAGDVMYSRGDESTQEQQEDKSPDVMYSCHDSNQSHEESTDVMYSRPSDKVDDQQNTPDVMYSRPSDAGDVMYSRGDESTQEQQDDKNTDVMYLRHEEVTSEVESVAVMYSRPDETAPRQISPSYPRLVNSSTPCPQQHDDKHDHWPSQRHDSTPDMKLSHQSDDQKISSPEDLHSDSPSDVMYSRHDLPLIEGGRKPNETVSFPHRRETVIEGVKSKIDFEVMYPRHGSESDVKYQRRTSTGESNVMYLKVDQENPKTNRSASPLGQEASVMYSQHGGGDEEEDEEGGDDGVVYNLMRERKVSTVPKLLLDSNLESESHESEAASLQDPESTLSPELGQKGAIYCVHPYDVECQSGFTGKIRDRLHPPSKSPTNARNSRGAVSDKTGTENETRDTAAKRRRLTGSPKNLPPPIPSVGGSQSLGPSPRSPRPKSGCPISPKSGKLSSRMGSGSAIVGTPSPQNKRSSPRGSDSSISNSKSAGTIGSGHSESEVGHLVGGDDDAPGGILLEETLSDQEDEFERQEISRPWNHRYQEICDEMYHLEDENDDLEGGRVTFKKMLNCKKDLYSLSQDFIYTAKTYGRIIILERYCEHKTIPLASLGGKAGGEKYIVNNALFKFAVDSEGFYANDDASAAKVASQELKGLMAYSSLGIREICVPLMAIVDFMGFRVTAMTLLPINRNTIVYGTYDAGLNIHAKNQKMNEVMRKAGKLLNLKPHFVGSRKNRKLLYSAADIEGHVGSDGRFYLLDFSRTFPPSAPDPQIRSGHLFQLFRVEFVMKHPIPLCSDAFSGFIQADRKRKDYNDEVIAATTHLTTQVIRALVRSLESSTPPTKEGYTLLASRLCEEFHTEGVNLRYLGRALMYVKDRALFEIILLEAIARVLKNDLNRRLRKKMSTLKVPVLGPYRNMVVSFMNRVFSSTSIPTSPSPKSRNKLLVLPSFYLNETAPSDRDLRSPIEFFSPPEESYKGSSSSNNSSLSISLPTFSEKSLPDIPHPISPPPESLHPLSSESFSPPLSPHLSLPPPSANLQFPICSSRMFAPSPPLPNETASTSSSLESSPTSPIPPTSPIFGGGDENTQKTNHSGILSKILPSLTDSESVTPLNSEISDSRCSVLTPPRKNSNLGVDRGMQWPREGAQRTKEVLDFYLDGIQNWKVSDPIWDRVVTTHLIRNFGVHPDHAAVAPALLAKKLVHIGQYARCLVFTRLQELTGCYFIDSAVNKLQESRVPKTPFDISSLLDFAVHVKHTVGVSNAQGSFYYMKALELIQGMEFNEAFVLLKRTKQIFEKSLKSSPNNKETLVQLTRVCRRILEVEQTLSAGANMKRLTPKELEVTFSKCIFVPCSVVEQTIRLFERVVDLDKFDSTVFFYFGCFLVQCQRLEEARNIILQCVQQDPDQPEYLNVYALLLSQMGHTSIAKQLICRIQFIQECKGIIDVWKMTKKLSDPFFFQSFSHSN